MSTSRFAPLVLSLGDPAGIGPELIAAAFAARAELDLPPFFVAGGAHVLESAARARGLNLTVAQIGQPGDAVATFADTLPVLAEGGDGRYTPGQPDAEGAALALHSLELATSLALSRAASGLVTAPVAKAALAQVGFAFPGQTEYLAHACGVAEQDAVMLLAGPSLKAVPLTIHVPISEVAGLITQDLILRRARVIHAAMQRDFGLPAPRLAVAGLNPHAGEKGRMGCEERDVIGPAIARLVAEGVAATGPHPADTMFAAHQRPTYDVALAMYHDQALVPLKALDFDEGVNMTLGLPIVRTSPDHGTAFDIAGKGTANPSSLIAAIRMAAQAAAHRAAAG